MTLVLLLCGLVGVWWGTEIAVRAAIRIAEARGYSQAFVGMTILAIGTDVPETVMAVIGGVQTLGGQDASGVVLGSAVGSCLGQIGMVLGLAGLFGYLTLGPKRLRTQGTMLFASIVLFFLAALDGYVSRVEGAIMLTAYVTYFAILLWGEKRLTDHEPRPLDSRCLRDVGSCALGLVLVSGFSYLVIEAAVSLAEDWGVGQTVVGVFMVGLGTSLPELALSVTAVRKKAGALSVGNIFGSNVFDSLVPPGVAALIAGLEVPSMKLLRIDLPAYFLLCVLVVVFFSRKRGLQRPEAAGLLVFYAAYVGLRMIWT